MIVYKYDLRISETNLVDMPIGSKLLCVQMQADKPQLWALVDEKQPEKELRQIIVIGTGIKLPNRDTAYISTFQMPNYGLVFHAFEVTS